MEKKIIIMAVVVLATTGNFQAETLAASCCGAPIEGYVDVKKVAGLNMTKKQKDLLAAIETRHMKELIPLQEGMDRKRNEMERLLQERPTYQKKYSAANKQFMTIREHLYNKRNASRKEIMKILTTKQQTALRPYGFSP